jgi:predicted nucleic acid-binding protein
VLALAIAAKVELIVSGDNDLLLLGIFEGVPIVVPAEAVTLIEATCRT